MRWRTEAKRRKNQQIFVAFDHEWQRTTAEGIIMMYRNTKKWQPTIRPSAEGQFKCRAQDTLFDPGLKCPHKQSSSKYYRAQQFDCGTPTSVDWCFKCKWLCACHPNRPILSPSFCHWRCCSYPLDLHTHTHIQSHTLMSHPLSSHFLFSSILFFIFFYLFNSTGNRFGSYFCYTFSE